MAANLLNQLQNDFSDDVTAKLASVLNETPAKTHAALGYAIPAVVGGLYQKAQTPQGASDLFSIFQRSGFDGSSFSGISNLLRGGSGPTDLIKTGGSFLSSLFGGRQASVTDSLAAASGLGKQASGSLLAIAASYVASLIGKEASASGGFNPASLANLVTAQGPSLAAVAPTGLAQMLGISSWGREEPTRTYERVDATPARAYEQTEKRGGFGWLLWAIPLLLLALLFWNWRSSRMETPAPVRSTAADLTPAPIGPAAAAVPLVKRTLTCGQQIDVAPNGVETKLMNFIDDPGQAVDDTTWFSFDRLEFETGSATLTAGSQDQLRNIATIMNCYPSVALKVGGYTDNVGDPAANLKLSQARADNTVAAIVGQGVSASRLSGQGYGQDHPVAANDTPEGRQQNRRIDLHVTRK